MATAPILERDGEERSSHPSLVQPSQAGERLLSKAAVLLLAAAQAVAADVSWWRAGGDGQGWEAVARNSTAVELAGDALRLSGFAAGDNIVKSLQWIDGHPQGGFVPERPVGHVWNNFPLKESDLVMVDGDSTTSTGDRFKRFGANQEGRIFFFDLGSRFPVRRVRFYPRQEGADSGGDPFAADFIRSYQLLVNDGTLFSADGSPIYEPVQRVDFTRESMAEATIPLRLVRYLRLNVLSPNPFEVAEFEVYGEGFVPRGQYLSQVVDLGSPANYGRITWGATALRQEGDRVVAAPEGDAGVKVQMRTGVDDSPEVYYQVVNRFTGEQAEVSRETYEQLDADKRGRVEDDQTDWSLWSNPFESSGSAIDLPSPRRYMQFRIVMESRDILEGVQVDSLAIEFAAPALARGIVGEISVEDQPRPEGGFAVVPAGRLTAFRYDVAADVREGDQGFGGLRISTPSRPRFRELLMGDPPVPVSPDSVAEEASGLTVYFPSAPVVAGGPARLTVVFDAQVFTQGTFFSGQALALEGDELPQPVLAGNAQSEIATDKLRVLTERRSARQVLSEIRMQPSIVTPNGDGHNDEAELSFSLQQLLEAVPMRVGVYDLSGRRVRDLFDGDAGTGIYEFTWDGRADGGGLMPAGLYMLRTEVQTGRRRYTELRMVAVAY